MLAPAAAADLSIAPIYKAPPPAPVTTWSGSYLGVSGGGAWGKAVVRNELTGADQTPRRVQSLAAQHTLMPQPTTLENNTGNAGAEGRLEGRASRGNPPQLINTRSSLLTVPRAPRELPVTALIRNNPGISDWNLFVKE